MKLKVIFVVLFFFTLSACSLPTEIKPGPRYKSSAIWMKALGLKKHPSSRLDRSVFTRGSQFVIFEPGLLKVRVGQKIVTLPKELRLWAGDLYMSDHSLSLLKKDLNFKIKSKPLIHSEWKPSVKERDWKYIVVHHSDTVTGSAAIFHRYHVEVNGWDELGYHFVIGNGTDSGDGLVEIGSRWKKQKYGAHAKTPSQVYNQQGIGICLVGDFCASSLPTSKQMKALVKLVSYMQDRYGIENKNVLRHGDVKKTGCPGENFPWQRFKKMIP